MVNPYMVNPYMVNPYMVNPYMVDPYMVDPYILRLTATSETDWTFIVVADAFSVSYFGSIVDLLLVVPLGLKRFALALSR